MKHRNLIRAGAMGLAVATVVALPLAWGATPATQPDAAAPTTQADGAVAEATTQPVEAKVTTEARAVLDQLDVAYGKLKSLELAGTVSADFDVAGETNQKKSEFTSAYASPDKFRHEMKDDVLVGSTGSKAYAYQKAANLFVTGDVKGADQFAYADLPRPVPQILEMQNPSLMFALQKKPSADLMHVATEISKTADTPVEKESLQTLRLKMAGDARVMLLLLDAQTHLLRQVRFDLKDDLEQRGAADVKKAMLTIAYTTTTADHPAAAEQFAWVPPAGAKDAAAQGGAAADSPAMALVGKPAPAFKLAGLDGKDVSLDQLKGSVVVLDIWATWCGPCVEGLPHVDKLYQDKKASGLRAFAVNQQEDKETVQGFINTKKLTLPVLLDLKGDLGQSYKADAIPETVIIGKDGVVKQVFVGTGPDTEEQLRKAVDQAMGSHS